MSMEASTAWGTLRSLKRRRCSSWLTENQGEVGAVARQHALEFGHLAHEFGMTPGRCKTHPLDPARLYQERSKRTISPLVGRCST